MRPKVVFAISRKLPSLSYIIALLILIVLSIRYYLLWLPLQKPQQDFFAIFLYDLQHHWHEVWIVSAGSTIMKPYALGAFFALPILFLIQKFVLTKRGVFLVWTNPFFLIYTEISIIIALLVALVGQYENWYFDPVRNISGEFDDVSHFLSGQMITAILSNIDFKDLFKLRGRWGRIGEIVFQWAIMGFVALYSEWNESVHPERYWSEYWDSLKDISEDLKGALIATANYNLIVPFEE